MGGEFHLPGGPGSRQWLICEINRLFNRQNVRATAKKLGKLAATGDFLDICNALGLLDDMHGGDLARYKRDLGIPGVNRALITAAFREALTARPQPIPLQVVIVSGTHEIVTMTGTATDISLVVIRNEAGRTAPRKKAAPRKR
jgi:hypothetical protein